MVRCRKQHKGKEKVVRARGKPMHRARTAWCTARTALISPSKGTTVLLSRSLAQKYSSPWTTNIYNLVHVVMLCLLAPNRLL